MSNSKISALTSATTPLAGTEILPIVQSGVTVKVASDDLTVRNIRANATTGILQITGPGAGTTRVATVPNANWTAARTDAAQSFTGDQTLSTGNLVIGTSGKGIDFSAAGGDVLTTYDEGTWTPTNSNPVTVNSAKYTRIGRIVICTFDITSNASGTTGDMTGLPFTPTNPTAGGIVSLQTVNGTETWSINIEASGVTNWSFRLGSTQKQLTASKNAKGMITYSL